MVQEIVYRFRQETTEAERYEEALKNLYSLCGSLLNLPATIRTPGRSCVQETLEKSLVAGEEEFNVRLQSGGRGSGFYDIMVVVIKDSQGRIAPVFYLSKFLRTVIGSERKFSQRLEIYGISRGILREEDIWDLDINNFPNCGLRHPTLDDIIRYKGALEDMSRALG